MMIYVRRINSPISFRLDKLPMTSIRVLGSSLSGNKSKGCTLSIKSLLTPIVTERVRLLFAP